MTDGIIVCMEITLNDVAPPVSRAVEIPLSIRLDRLHTVFQLVLTWTNTQLWQMVFGETVYGIPSMDYGFDGRLDARKITLARAVGDSRLQTFRYIYNLRDRWEHSVELRGIERGDPHLTYPRIIEATGERPPEDGGGSWSYAEKLEALKNPKHPNHEEALEILGEDYDANRQPDIGNIAQGLRTLATRWATQQLQ